MTNFKEKPAEAQWMTPYLMVRDMKAQIAFCKDALGLELANTMEGPDGATVHAEFRHKGTLVAMCAPEGAFGSTAKSPASAGVESPLTLYLYVDDVDAAYEKAKAAGTAAGDGPANMFWGDRTFHLTDPSGYSWSLASHIGADAAPPPEMHAG